MKQTPTFLILIVALAWGTASWRSPAVEAAPRPNIVLIMADAITEQAVGMISPDWRLPDMEPYLDWGQHHFDLAHWGMGMDDSGPLSIDAKGDLVNVDKVEGHMTNFESSGGGRLEILGGICNEHGHTVNPDPPEQHPIPPGGGEQEAETARHELQAVFDEHPWE